MDPRRNKSRSLLILIALASGAALVALVGYGLVRTTQEAQDRAAWAARRDARDLALALQAALRRPDVLQLCDASSRFAVVDGSLVIDDVAWLQPRESKRLDGVTRHRLEQAQRAEFVHRNPQAARERFDEVLERLDYSSPATWSVLAQAAWQAHRAGDAGRRDARRRQLDKQLNGLQAELFDDALVVDALLSASLLTATIGEPLPPAHLALLPMLPRAAGTAALLRLQELGVDTAPHLQALTAKADRRDLLREAAALVYEAGRTQRTSAHDGRLTMWFPQPEGKGVGAVVDADWLRRLPGLGTTRPTELELPPIPDRGTLLFELIPGAEPVLPSFAWVESLPLPAPPWFASPTALLTASISLLLLFAGSGWTTLRSLTRETAAMRVRSDFLSGVTHELKTPVASLRLIADVLHDDDVAPARQQEYFSMMAGECARLSALIDNVLDLGQMERGERAYDLRDDDAAEVVREAVQAFIPLGTHQGIVVELAEDVRTAPAVFDRGAITQTLLNLLENARKYASSGKRIEVSTRIAEHRFVVRVRDHGPGIAEHERERIFERFHRGSNQQSGSIAGVGLGLFLSRSIMRHHGGTLTCAAPTSGQGCVFELALPLHHEDRS